MVEVDTFWRCGTLSLALLIAIVLVKDHWREPAGILAAAFVLGGGIDQMFPLLVLWGLAGAVGYLHLVSLATLFAFWLLARALFEDGFRWRWSYVLVYLALVVASLAGHYLTYGVGFGVQHWILRTEPAHGGLWLLPLLSMIAVLVLHALYAALKDWRVDLVESRRRGRIGFVLVVGVIILSVSIAEVLALGTPRSGLADSIGAAVSFALILAAGAYLLEMRRGRLAEPRRLEFASETPEQVESVTGDEPGAPVVVELRRLMEEERLYTEEGLTIGRLADRMGVKEYRLRRLINGHLGYRNFNQFLNRYRVDEAARQLVAPETRHLPVLSIALDVGYRSLAPFNKAFKDTYGVTPTAYRSAPPDPG